jgi:hypothetical protein
MGRGGKKNREIFRLKFAKKNPTMNYQQYHQSDRGLQLRPDKKGTCASPNPFRVLSLIITSCVLMTLPMQAASFQRGQPFPDVLLPSLENGEPLSIGQFQGQKLMLHLFASW